MEVKTFVSHHLVKGSDLNHHGTLYAGRGAEWFVEAGFVAASSLTSTESTVCLNIHGMVFTKPAPKGTLLRYDSRIVYTGKTSLVAYVQVVYAQTGEFVVDGFMTFVHVDENGNKCPHGILIEAKTPEEHQLHERVKSLNKARRHGI